MPAQTHAQSRNGEHGEDGEQRFIEGFQPDLACPFCNEEAGVSDGD